MVQQDFVDSYTNVTMDTIFALKFAKSLNGKQRPKHLYIGDDDTYVNVPKLWEKLYGKIPNRVSRTMNESSLPSSLFVFQDEIDRHNEGRIQGRQSRFTKVHKPIKNAVYKNNILRKWTVPSYFLDQDTYPDYVNGGGYVVKYNMVGCLYKGAQFQAFTG